MNVPALHMMGISHVPTMDCEATIASLLPLPLPSAMVVLCWPWSVAVTQTNVRMVLKYVGV